uniref:Secreted protein n=1 Tax=Ascaris lumbricoides TaxID=6252 RepID=A0A0M3HF94_ASCLU
MHLVYWLLWAVRCNTPLRGGGHYQRRANTRQYRPLAPGQHCMICYEEQPDEPMGCLNCRQLIGCRKCVMEWRRTNNISESAFELSFVFQTFAIVDWLLLGKRLKMSSVPRRMGPLSGHSSFFKGIPSPLGACRLLPSIYRGVCAKADEASLFMKCFFLMLCCTLRNLLYCFNFFRKVAFRSEKLLLHFIVFLQISSVEIGERFFFVLFRIDNSKQIVNAKKMNIHTRLYANIIK